MTTAAPEITIAELGLRLDRLSEHVEAIAEEAAIQRRRREAWLELLEDARPVTSQAFELTARQLQEVSQYVSLEDVGHLAKRLLRNTRNLEQMLDRMESLAELINDFAPIGHTAFFTLIEQMEEWDRKGYFEFGREAFGILDEIVASFTKEDVKALGENIALILTTVKEMTQPEVMGMVRRTAFTVREQEPPRDITLLALLRQMRDPATKRGLAKVLMTLRSLAGEEPAPGAP